MSRYFKRIVTYDNDTKNYVVFIPELNVTVYGDTETSAMRFAREEVELAAKTPEIVQTDNYTDYHE